MLRDDEMTEGQMKRNKPERGRMENGVREEVIEKRGGDEGVE